MRLGLAVWVALASSMLAACGAALPATLEFVDQTPAQPRLGEITTLRFRAIDSRGQPQPGVLVNFALQSAASGVQVLRASGTTNVGDGTVTTQVVATAGDKKALSPAITFAGADSSGTQFTFQCGEVSGASSGGIHAIGAFDDTRYLIAGVKLNCIAHVADRNGDGIAGAQVSFLTEAGTIGPSASTLTDVVGNAKVLYKSSYPLPEDVAPGTFSWNPLNDATHTGEFIAPLWMHPFLWVQNPIRDYNVAPTFEEPRRADPIRPGIINNPRDNLVSLIAVTSGEEAYEDNNNNGRYDSGEPFGDLTEPFVDNNDNGTWDSGERFVDSDGNGRWDGKNGKHDSSTLLWVQERILWTGWPHGLDRTLTAQNPSPVVRQLSPAEGVPIALAKFEARTVTFMVSDPWFNRIAQNSESDGCAAETVGPVEVKELPTGIAFTYPSFHLQQYYIKDSRDPSDEQAPNYTTAIPFSVAALCAYTASPIEGHKAPVHAPTVTGTVGPP